MSIAITPHADYISAIISILYVPASFLVNTFEMMIQNEYLPTLLVYLLLCQPFQLQGMHTTLFKLVILACSSIDRVSHPSVTDGSMSDL